MSMSCPIRQVIDMSATSVGEIGLDLVVNQGQFNKQMSGITGLAKNAGAALAAAFAVKTIVNFGKQCIELGSDLQEVQNVVDVVFPAMSSQVDDFAKSAAATFGLSETMAKQYTGTFGAMAKAFGFSEQQAYDMSTALTGLAGDVASFYNITQDEAYTKLKSVFTGETETLKDLGVVMTQSALDAYALANGFGKTTSAMSEAEKVALRYSFVQNQLTAAAGDFSRTSGSWANQVRLLSLQFDSLKSTIGQGLIAALTPVLELINHLISRLQTLANAFKELMEGLFGKQQDSSGASSVAAAAQTAASASSSMADSTGQTAANLKKASKFFAGFDTVQTIGQDSSESSGSSGGSGGSTGGGVSGLDMSSLSAGTIDTSGLEESTAKIESILAPLRKINFEPLRKSLEELKKSLKGFGENIWKGLKWGYENILVPFAAWTIEDALPAFLTALGKAIDFVSAIIEVSAPYFEQFFDYIIKPLADFVGSAIVRFWEDIGYAFDFFAGVIRDNPALGEIIAGIGAAIGTVAAAMGLVNLVTSMNPFGLIALAVAVLIAVIGELVRNWDAIKETASRVWEAIKKAWNAAGEWFKKNVVEPVVSFFSSLWESVTTLASNAWSGITGVFTSAGNWFKTKVVTPITNFFSGLWNGVKSAASSAWSRITGVFTSAANWFKAKVITPISSFFSGLWSGIKETASNAWNGILNLFSSGGQIFSGIVDGVANVFKTIVNALISGINTIIATPFNTINGLLNKIRNVSVLGVSPFKGLWKESPLPVPQIPKLAQGGWVEKNTPQLAMIGDNRHQGEIVAPEDKLREMAEAAAGSGNKEVIQLLKRLVSLVENLDFNVILEFRGQLSALARLLEPYLEKERQRKGSKITKGGTA